MIITAIITRNVDSYDALQLECRPTSCQLFRALITRPIMHQARNSTIPRGIFWQSMNIYQYFGQICTAVNSTTPIFWKRAIIWLSDEFSVFFSYCTDRKSAIFLLPVYWPNDLAHLSDVALHTGIIFTKSELGQPIRSWLTTNDLKTVFRGLSCPKNTYLIKFL